MSSIDQNSWLIDENIGALIRKLREEQGFKGSELAEKAGIDRTYLIKIEKNNMLPSFFVMKKISDSLRKPELLEVYMRIKFPSLILTIKSTSFVNVSTPPSQAL